MDYSIRNLREVEDVAAKHGLAGVQEARFPRQDLGAETIAFIHLTIHPGQRQAFAHRHERAEEIYVVLAGRGRVKLDDEVVEVGELDAIRVGPQVTRAFEAGPGGLRILGFGPRHDADGEIVPMAEFWGD